MLAEELPHAGGYARILAAVGRGRTHFGEIAAESDQRVERPIEILIRAGLLAKTLPVGGPRGARRRATSWPTSTSRSGLGCCTRKYLRSKPVRVGPSCAGARLSGSVTSARCSRRPRERTRGGLWPGVSCRRIWWWAAGGRPAESRARSTCSGCAVRRSRCSARPAGRLDRWAVAISYGWRESSHGSPAGRQTAAAPVGAHRRGGGRRTRRCARVLCPGHARSLSSSRSPAAWDLTSGCRCGYSRVVSMFPVWFIESRHRGSGWVDRRPWLTLLERSLGADWERDRVVGFRGSFD